MTTLKKLICSFCLVFALGACSSNPDYANKTSPKLEAISEEEKEPITVLSFSPPRHQTPIIKYELIDNLDQDNSTVITE